MEIWANRPKEWNVLYVKFAFWICQEGIFNKTADGFSSVSSSIRPYTEQVDYDTMNPMWAHRNRAVASCGKEYIWRHIGK